jgi:plastocyanin
MKTYRHSLAVLTLFLVSFTTQAANVIIKVGDNFYDPIQVTIKAGDVVTWQYQGGSATHPTASDNTAWSTFLINTANPTQSITFSTPGNFPYHCTFHGGPGTGMFGSIKVDAVTPVHSAILPAEAFRCYPNPAREQVTVALKEGITGSSKAIQVFDVRGNMVRNVAVRPNLPNHEMAMTLSDLPGGLYMYCLVVNNAVVARQRLALIR